MFHNKRKIIAMCVGLLTLIAAVDSGAQGVSGRPVKVLSGDRLLLMADDNTTYRIALAGIAAPPPEDRWGAAAQRHLGMLVLGRVVRVEFVGHAAQSEELPGKVLLGGADINLRMIQASLARHLPTGQAKTDRIAYAEAEQRARKAQQGIWRPKPPTDRSRRIPGGPVPQLNR